MPWHNTAELYRHVPQHLPSVPAVCCRRDGRPAGLLTLGFGMSPLGPRMRPSLTSCGIMSGVAMQAVKSIDLPLLSRMEATRSAEPTTSAPVGRKAGGTHTVAR